MSVEWLRAAVASSQLQPSAGAGANVLSEPQLRVPARKAFTASSMACTPLFLKALPHFKGWGPYREMRPAEWEEVFACLEDSGAVLTVGVTAAWVNWDGSLTPFPEKYPGEAAVLREVWEEAGVRVGQVSYLASQPWPFPDSLMVGFTADHAGGSISVDNDEIFHADWFSRNDLPRIPPPISIAGQLIDTWVNASPPASRGG